MHLKQRFLASTTMGKKMTRAGMLLRRNIRAELDANPGIDRLAIRSKYKVVKNGLVDPRSEYEVYLHKITR